MKVSVITISYNSEKFIEQTIKSINNQTYSNLEHIIVDGNSSDSTLSIVNSLAMRSPIIISENDNGIYDAWNKGVALATGDIICFCNTDDYWPNDYVEAAMKTLVDYKDSIIFGDVVMVSRDDLDKSPKELGFYSYKKLYRGFGFRTTSIFFGKHIFDSVGGFDCNYRIAGDTDWLLRALRQGFKFIHSDHFLYMRDGGVSNKYEVLAYKEYLFSLSRNNMIFIKSYYVYVKKIIKGWFR